MTELDKHKATIEQLCLDHNVKHLYVFGSVLTDRFTEKSDIDLVVDFDQIEVNEYADNYFDFKFCLEKVLNRRVDLLEDQAIKNPYFRQVINQSRQLVYGH